MVLVLLFSFLNVDGAEWFLVLSSLYNFKLSLVEREGERGPDDIAYVCWGFLFILLIFFSPLTFLT